MNDGLPTRLLLIRHAHVDTGARLCGTLDVPLSATGRAQLHTLLHQADAPPPAALYTSALRRAREVADALSRLWHLTAIEAAIHEISCGPMEGWPLDDLQRRHPGLWARNEAQNDDDFCWPGGETYRQFRSRVLAGLGGIARNHAGRRVAVVTHAGVIAQVLGTIQGRPAAVWEEDRPEPLSATEILWCADVPQRVLSYNERRWYQGAPTPVEPRAPMP